MCVYVECVNHEPAAGPIQRIQIQASRDSGLDECNKHCEWVFLYRECRKQRFPAELLYQSAVEEPLHTYPVQPNCAEFANPVPSGTYSIPQTKTHVHTFVRIYSQRELASFFECLTTYMFHVQ